MLNICLFTRSTIPLFMLLSGLLIPPLSAQNTGISTAPTAAMLTPEQLDSRWVAATAAFAPQRARVLSSVEITIGAGPFQPDWDSLTTYTVPDWFRDATFGIFIHWGVFSVPAFDSDWYSRNMYLPHDADLTDRDYAHHLATFGSQTTAGYKDFIPKFRMEHFDSAAWALLFR